MKSMIRKAFGNDIIRYLFCGVLTVLVNLASFYLFTEVLAWELDISNILSVIAALLFAYITNTLFVFQSKCNGIKERFNEFARFVTARIVTMLIEIVCVHFMVEKCLLNSLLSKAVIQIIVIVLNYIFSKKLVYKKV